MRVTHLHFDLPPAGRGGVGYQVDLLARTMAELGHSVRVVSTTPGPSDATYEVDVVHSPSTGRFPRLRRQYGVAVAFRGAELDGQGAVHAHGDDWLMPKHVRRVRTFYGSAIHESRTATSILRKCAQRCQYRLEHRSARLATTRVAISEHSRPLIPNIDRVIPCAVDERLFGGIGGRSPTREPSVLYVAGSLGGRKRGQVLLDAFREVRRRWSDATLHLVTRDDVEGQGVRRYSNLTPGDLAALYLSSWVFASPSSYEGFGVPYAEALTAGLPIIATRNPGAEEVLEKGRLGLVTEVEGFPADLVGLLDDDDRRRNLGAAGRVASQQYSSRIVANEYLDLYRSLA